MPSWSAVSCFRPFKGGAESTYSKSCDFSSEDSDKRLSFISEGRKGVSVVELVKKERTTLGLIISGGIDKGCRPKIANLRPGSIAHRSDCLAIGDYIISVNGIRTTKLKHDEIVSLLKNTGDKVTLEVEYELPLSSAEGSLCLSPKVIQLQIEKENDSFGFTLRGGACGDKLKCRPLIITHVRFGGPANREGSIKSGDRLLAVDGINLSGATLQETLTLLKQVNGAAVFTIEYDVSVIDAVRNASGPLLVEINKTQGVQLGISLTCLMLPEPAIVIESIRQASVAERCGALHVGDHVLAIDGIKVDLMTSAEAMQLLKSSSETVKLEILPVSQMALRRIPETSVKRVTGNTIPHYLAARASYTNSCYNTLSSLGSLSVASAGQFRSVTPPLTQRGKWTKMNGNVLATNAVSLSSSNASLLASANGTHPAIGRADTTEVVLPASHKGFGFTLQGSSFPSEIFTAPPVITCLESGSPAEKCGTLQVGDRVLSVNGENTEGLTLDEVLQLVLHSHPKLILKTEFDVAETVVPSSGTFVVKLAKRRTAGLGITVTAPKNRQPGEPLIISSVETGSVAHRSGTIQPGDKLLAVDLVRMECCTVEDASSILYSCGEITTLRIRKDETFCDDPDATSATVYTVELARHGGPLGITVSGTEEPFDPILISGLTDNGLAERTGALHVGDRILAINGTCLRGKPLSKAIHILQSCGDVVTLKLSRNPDSGKTVEENDTQLKCIHCVPENHLKSFTTPLPNVDSALESWDSCNLDACSGIKSDSKQEECAGSKGNLASLSSCQPCSSKQQTFDQLNQQDNWCAKRHSFNSCHSFSGRSALSDDGKENWSKVLEDLETCGQSQLIRHIERTILGNDETDVLSDVHSISRNSFCNDATKCPSDTLSEQSLQELHAQIEQLGSNLDLPSSDAAVGFDDQAPSCSQEYTSQCARNNGCHSVSSRLRTSPTFAIPLPIEVHKVTLFKDQVYEDFGFSVSDGLYEHGVYINCIRAGGPADISGLIKPFDRILQVNNVKTYNYDCCLTVPLIASSEDRIELVISRPAYDTGSSSESTLGRACGHHPWVDDIDHEASLSPFHSHTESQTLTKTL